MIELFELITLVGSLNGCLLQIELHLPLCFIVGELLPLHLYFLAELGRRWPSQLVLEVEGSV